VITIFAAPPGGTQIVPEEASYEARPSSRYEKPPDSALRDVTSSREPITRNAPRWTPPGVGVVNWSTNVSLEPPRCKPVPPQTSRIGRRRTDRSSSQTPGEGPRSVTSTWTYAAFAGASARADSPTHESATGRVPRSLDAPAHCFALSRKISRIDSLPTSARSADRRQRVATYCRCGNACSSLLDRTNRSFDVGADTRRDWPPSCFWVESSTAVALPADEQDHDVGHVAIPASNPALAGESTDFGGGAGLGTAVGEGVGEGERAARRTSTAFAQPSNDRSRANAQTAAPIPRVIASPKPTGLPAHHGVQRGLQPRRHHRT
jgi:hypothetical protein